MQNYVEPGGSLKIISGMSGAAVTNVWLPSDLPPKIIQSDYNLQHHNLSH
jgi:hypothetical protein